MNSRCFILKHSKKRDENEPTNEFINIFKSANEKGQTWREVAYLNNGTLTYFMLVGNQLDFCFFFDDSFFSSFINVSSLDPSIIIINDRLSTRKTHTSRNGSASQLVGAASRTNLRQALSVKIGLIVQFGFQKRFRKKFKVSSAAPPPPSLFPILGRSSRERLSNCLSTPKTRTRPIPENRCPKRECSDSRLKIRITNLMFSISLFVFHLGGGFFNRNPWHPGKGVEYVIIPQSL